MAIQRQIIKVGPRNAKLHREPVVPPGKAACDLHEHPLSEPRAVEALRKVALVANATARAVHVARLAQQWRFRPRYVAGLVRDLQIEHRLAASLAALAFDVEGHDAGRFVVVQELLIERLLSACRDLWPLDEPEADAAVGDEPAALPQVDAPALVRWLDVLDVLFREIPDQIAGSIAYSGAVRGDVLVARAMVGDWLDVIDPFEFFHDKASNNVEL